MARRMSLRGRVQPPIESASLRAPSSSGATGPWRPSPPAQRAAGNVARRGPDPRRIELVLAEREQQSRARSAAAAGPSVATASPYAALAAARSRADAMHVTELRARARFQAHRCGPGGNATRRRRGWSEREVRMARRDAPRPATPAPRRRRLAEAACRARATRDTRPASAQCRRSPSGRRPGSTQRRALRREASRLAASSAS